MKCFASMNLCGLCVQGAPYRSALRVIAEKFLKRQIQAGSHDSADDARAAMDLALLKIRRAALWKSGSPAPLSCSLFRPERWQLLQGALIFRVLVAIVCVSTGQTWAMPVCAGP